VNKDAAQSLLLVEQDDHVIDRVQMVAGSFCSVLPFGNAVEVADWLANAQQANLIVTDQASGHPLIATIKKR
jgi:urocanate hydratase